MRSRNKLNVRQVASISKQGMHSDGGGLYLRVRPTGTKSWVFVSNAGGKRREWGLGSALDISLAKARERAEAFRQQIVDGQVPQGIRQKRNVELASVPTFGEFATGFIDEVAKGLSNPKHASQWRNTIRTYGEPILDLPIDSITTDHMLEVLEPIWTQKAESAKRVRGRIERILNGAQVKGLRTGENPARFKGHLELLLSKQSRGGQSHHAALSFRDLPAFIAKLRSRTGSAAVALEFLILTAGRTGEVLGATWEEIDLDAGLWTIPADRMKARTPHEVPLCPAVTELLAPLQEANRGKGYVFRSGHGGALSNMAMAQLLKRMGYDAITVHGFRSTFRDWAGEVTEFERETIEMALAHSIGSKAEQAYRRARAIGKRRELDTRKNLSL